MTRLASLALLAALLLSPLAAHADDGGAAAEEPEEPEEPKEQEGRWYGWELALSDALFLMVAADGNASNPELPIGAAGYPIGLAGVIFGAPALHYLHGNPGRARVGLFVRGITVPLFALAQTTLNRQSGDAVDGGVFLLAGLGGAAAVTAVVFAFIDDIWYARAPAPARGIAVAPTWFASRGGGGAGVLGLF